MGRFSITSSWILTSKGNDKSKFLPLLVTLKYHKRPGSSLAKLVDCPKFKLLEAQEKRSGICCFLKFYGYELCALCNATSCISLSNFLSNFPPSFLCLGTSNSLSSFGSQIEELRWLPPFLLTKATIIDSWVFLVGARRNDYFVDRYCSRQRYWLGFIVINIARCYLSVYCLH